MIIWLLIVMACQGQPDPNLPTSYRWGYFRLMSNCWLKTPTGYFHKQGDPNMPPSDDIGYGRSYDDPNDPYLLTADYVVQMDIIDMKSVGRYAEGYRGELEFALPPPPPEPEKPSRIEVMAMFAELLWAGAKNE